MSQLRIDCECGISFTTDDVLVMAGHQGSLEVEADPDLPDGWAYIEDVGVLCPECVKEAA